jgi:hypothetical protein
METAGIPADNRVKVVTEFPRGPDALEAVRYWVALNPDCKLVIIDVLEQVRDRDALHENSYSENVREIAQWKKLAQDLDIYILGLTHDRKMRADDFVNSLMGSVGAVGSSGVIWSLKRSRGKADAVLYATGWNIRDFDLPLLFGEETGWQLLDGAPQNDSRARSGRRS